MLNAEPPSQSAQPTAAEAPGQRTYWHFQLIKVSQGHSRVWAIVWRTLEITDELTLWQTGARLCVL